MWKVPAFINSLNLTSKLKPVLSFNARNKLIYSFIDGDLLLLLDRVKSNSYIHSSLVGPLAGHASAHIHIHAHAHACFESDCL